MKQKVPKVPNGTRDGSYIGLNISKESEKRLKQLQKDLNIEETFPFHITLVYSRKKIKMDINKNVNKIITVKCFHIFDNSKDGGDRALVIKLNCPYCENRHNIAKTGFGATFDYPNYEPHITLSYKWEKDLPDDNILKDLKLNITSEYYEKLNLEWKEDNIEKVKTLKESKKNTPYDFTTDIDRYNNINEFFNRLYKTKKIDIKQFLFHIFKDKNQAKVLSQLLQKISKIIYKDDIPIDKLNKIKKELNQIFLTAFEDDEYFLNRFNEGINDCKIISIDKSIETNFKELILRYIGSNL